MSHTINVTDFTDQDTLHQILSEIQNHGTSYALVQDGIEVAKVVPAEKRMLVPDEKVSDEVTEKRQKVFERMDKLAERIAELWNTDETAAEAVANNRRF